MFLCTRKMQFWPAFFRPISQNDKSYSFQNFLWDFISIKINCLYRYIAFLNPSNKICQETGNFRHNVGKRQKLYIFSSKNLFFLKMLFWTLRKQFWQFLREFWERKPKKICLLILSKEFCLKSYWSLQNVHMNTKNAFLTTLPKRFWEKAENFQLNVSKKQKKLFFFRICGYFFRDAKTFYRTRRKQFRQPRWNLFARRSKSL